MAGDVEFKQNKFLPAEKQILTCNPDINIVSVWQIYFSIDGFKPILNILLNDGDYIDHECTKVHALDE